jgi:hypothetical protein
MIRRKVLRAAGVTAFLGALTSDAQQSTAQRSNNDYALINSHVVIVMGTVVKGHSGSNACQIAVTLPPGQNAVEGRGIGQTTFNGDTCQLQMEIGEPPASAISSRARVGAPQRCAGSRPRPVHHERLLRGLARRSSRYLVNSEQANLSWLWRVIPAMCPSIYQAWRSQPTPPFVGWWNIELLAAPFSLCAATPPVGFQIFSQYEDQNFPLCYGSGDTTVYATYDNVAALGSANGVLSGAWVLEVGGPPCINLLSPGYQLTRTYTNGS